MPGNPRNHEVENHEGHILATRHFEAIDAVASNGRFVASVLQVQFERVCHYRVVLYDHNLQAAPLLVNEIVLVPAIFRFPRQPADQDW